MKSKGIFGKLIVFFLFLSLACISLWVFANEADIDPSMAVWVSPGFNLWVSSLYVQPDGKIIVGGWFDTYKWTNMYRIARINNDGTRDTWFGTISSGFNNVVYSIAAQSDGKLIVWGNFTTYKWVSSNRIIRLNSDGSKDDSLTIGTAFGNIVYSIALQSDNKILVGGTFTTYSGVTLNRLARLNSDGILDTGFDIGSAFNNFVRVVKVQTDGKILVGGEYTTYSWVSANRIVRLNADGTRDTWFNIGSAFNGKVYTIDIQSGGKILVWGDFTSYSGVTSNRIVRLNTDGTRDTSFTIGTALADWYVTTEAQSILTQADGKILVVGNFGTYSWASSSKIVRLNADGTRDTSFVVWNWFVGNSATSLAIDGNGKILVGGSNFWYYKGIGAKNIIRLNDDWSRDTSFDDGNGFWEQVMTSLIDANGKILLGGSFRSYQWIESNKFIRLNVDGSIDNTLVIASWFTNANDTAFVSVVTLQPDEKILVWGQFTGYKWIGARNIIRLNPDGSIDTSFTIGVWFNNAVRAIALQSDGKMVVGGAFSQYSWSVNRYIARLNSNGTKDTGFNIGTAFDVPPETIAIQDDGKILVWGNFTTYSGTAANKIIRLNSDGTRDTSFEIGTWFTDIAGAIVNKIILDWSWNIFVGGDFTHYSWSTANCLVKLTTTGAIDPSFNPWVWFTNDIKTLNIDVNGKILAWGYFTTYQWATANYLIRLNPDGSRDTTFDIGNGPSQSVSTITIMSNGNILLGGGFTSYRWFPVAYLMMLYGTTDIVTLPDSTNVAIVEQEFFDHWYTKIGDNLVWTKPISLDVTDGLIPINISLKNNDVIIELPANTQFKKSDNTTNYSGVIGIPINTSVGSISNNDVLSSFKAWSSTESIKLAWWVATIYAPAPWESPWNTVNIYYSENNWSDWYIEKIAPVIDYNGSPYTVFTANHFTDFAITLPVDMTGTFTINNDDASTLSPSVTLNISTTPAASYMRFSDDWISWSAREAYTTSKAWTLPWSYGVKTVYAQFDADGDQVSDVETNDSINYTDGTSPCGAGGPNEWCITLELTWDNDRCVYGTSINLGSHSMDYNAFNMTGLDFTPSTWYCADMQGHAPRTLSVQLTDNLTNQYGQSIPTGNVYMYSTPNYILSWSCSTWITEIATRNEIGTARVVLEKSSAMWQICTIATDTVNLAVEIPAAQPIGMYTWTLTVTLPR